MAVRLNGVILAPGTVVEIDQVPPQFRVKDDIDGSCIVYEWPENPDYLPHEDYVGYGTNGTLVVRVPLFDRETRIFSEGIIEIDGTLPVERK